MSYLFSTEIRNTQKKRRFYDRCQHWVVRSGAFIVLSVLIMMILLLLAQVLPIFHSPSLELVAQKEMSREEFAEKFPDIDFPELFKENGVPFPKVLLRSKKQIPLADGHSWLIKDTGNHLSLWFIANGENKRRWVQALTFELDESLIQNGNYQVVTTPVNNGFFVVAGNKIWRYIPIMPEPRFNKLLAFSGSQSCLFTDNKLTFFVHNRLVEYRYEDPYEQLNWHSLWRKVWYPGYEKPAYIWQGQLSGKYSLVPLIYGSLKAAFYALVFAIPVALLAAVYTGFFMPARWRIWVKSSIELMAALPSVIIGFLCCYWLAPWLELHLFSPYFPEIGYSQQNTILVGFALGIAVIPTIFTIAEDAIYSVPSVLVQGALALGASPWQALTKVVLLTASPGIFSAVMLGLGRAVGETMIVLMVSGNTPVMSGDPMQGLRSLSATLAIEIGQSQVGSPAFRVLFLAALVLFVFTLVINSIAALVRQHLKQKYSELS